MRIPPGLIFVVALIVTPPAAADDRPAPPDVVIVVSAGDGPSSLAWSPVSNADAYVIFRGDSPSTLAPYATTTALFFIDEDARGDAHYGVATRAGAQTSAVHSSGGGGSGDCVRANTNLHFQITVWNCLRT